MQTTWKTVRVFISSTFRDMQSERDWLVRFVFPKLRQELLQRRIHLVDVDLRWGVTSEQDALSVCREVVDECRPRFLCMLGGRYGWVPPGNTRSITADEVHYGVLDRDLKSRGFAYFYFRDPSATAGMVEVAPGEFREPAGSHGAVALAELKAAITGAGLQPFIYRAQWDDQSRRLIGLKEFGDRVYADLQQSIDQEFGPTTGEKPDEFTEENAAMEAFIEERVQRFVLGSRQPVWNEIRHHAESTGGNGYLCLTGAAGSGKSALLGRLCQDFRAAHPQDLVIPHFVGASPGSTDVRRTLRRLCHELVTGAGLTAEIPEDPEKLRVAFAEFLQQASARKRVVILLDAINQFDSTTQLAGWSWLPEELPATARIILSTLGGPALDSLRQRRQPPGFAELQPLDDQNRESIIREFLHRYRKSMTDDQRAALLAKTDAGTPLYLLVALEELRTLGTYEEITDRIAQLPPDTRALFIWILERLEDDDGFRDASGRKIGGELVSRFASLLGASRHGLSQQELVKLLSPGDPQGNVAALTQLLRPYLMQRGELLDFYHGQFREAAGEAYLPSEYQRLVAHDQLAIYFSDEADPDRNRSWTGQSPRPFLELPFHLACAHSDKLAIILIDFRFLSEKCQRISIFSVLADFDLAIQNPPVNVVGRTLVELRRCLQVNSGFLERFPTLLFQQAYNALVWRPHNWPKLDEALRESTLNWTHPWIRLVNPPSVATDLGIWRVLDSGTTSSILRIACLRRAGTLPHWVVAVAHDDGALRCWNLESGETISQMSTGGRRVLALRIAPDGTELFGYTSDGHLFVFQIDSGQNIRLAHLWTEETECASFVSDPDAKDRPILCAWAKSGRIYLAYSGGRVQTITHCDVNYVSAITFLGEQPRIVLGGISNDAVVNGVTKSRPPSHVEIVGWEDQLRAPLSVGEGTFGPRLTGWINSLATNDSGDAFLTASEMWETDEHSEFEAMFLGQVALWRKDAARWQPVFCQGDGSGSFAAAYNAATKQIVAAMWDKGLVLWSDDGREIGRVKLASRSCGALCWANRAVPTVLASEGSRIKCFESSVFQRHASDEICHRHSAAVHTGDISPDLHFVVTGSADERVMLSELVEGQPPTFKWSRDQTHRVNTVAFGSGGEVYSGGYHWMITSRLRSDGSIVAESRNDGGRVGTICVSPSGRLLAVANTDGSGFSIWSNKLERLGGPFEFRLPAIKTPMAFSAEDRLLALPEDRRGVVVARLTDLAEIRDRPSALDTSRGGPLPVVDRIPTTRRVNALRFAHCSDTVAVADDQVVRLVRAGSQESLMEWSCPAVTFLTFSPRDQLLAVGTATFVLVFDTRTGEEAYRMPTSSPVLCLRFSRDEPLLAYIDDGRSTEYAPQCGVLQLEQAECAGLATKGWSKPQ